MMKKKTLYGLIALILIIAAMFFSIYLYEKYTVRFSNVYFEDLEFEPFDFFSSRSDLEQTVSNTLEE